MNLMRNELSADLAGSLCWDDAGGAVQAMQMISVNLQSTDRFSLSAGVQLPLSTRQACSSGHCNLRQPKQKCAKTDLKRNENGNENVVTNGNEADNLSLLCVF